MGVRVCPIEACTSCACKSLSAKHPKWVVQLSCVYRSMNESEVLDDARWHDKLEVDDVWAADSDCGDSGEEDVDDADDVALAALYRAEHHSLYMTFMEML